MGSSLSPAELESEWLQNIAYTDSGDGPSARASATAPLPAWYQGACADVALNKEGALLLKESFTDPDKHAGQALITRTNNMWDNGTTISLCFLNQSPGTGMQQEKVKVIIKEWEKYANLKFKHLESQDAMLRVTFDPKIGSWSYMGKENLQVPLSQATMNLAQVSPGSTIIGNDLGIVLHEFGHALGLVHEFHSPLKGGRYSLRADNVAAFYRDSQTQWTEENVYKQILNIYNSGNVTNFFQPDLSSIMMYFMPSEMNLQNIPVLPNTRISDLDKAFMFISYPFPERSDADPIWTIEHALDVAGVEGDYRDFIVDAHGKQNWTNVRYFFTVYWAIRRSSSGRQVLTNLH